MYDKGLLINRCVVQGVELNEDVEGGTDCVAYPLDVDSQPYEVYGIYVWAEGECSWHLEDFETMAEALNGLNYVRDLIKQRGSVHYYELLELMQKRAV